ncbi:MAG TPA: hypothetical protein VGD21_09595 [Lysobacter sp.]
MQARLVLGVALVATVLLYWVGLTGPFLYDDLPNLGKLQGWLAGTTSWQNIVFGNVSGLIGRPIPMATFMLSAAMGGMEPFYFKLGNLVVHLGCGVLGWLVLRRALAEDSRFAASADLVASLIVALWLVHPLNASTVLYVVQRMAQLSALFVLASVWVYLIARRDLIAGRMRPALIKLFLLFPLLVVAGLLSKENAAVAPALCLVLELAYFAGQPRPRHVMQAFFGVFLALPVIALVALLVLEPNLLLGGYEVRDFTLQQRLLSQPRALMDYVGTVLFPRSPLLGLYTDDFQLSTGLLSPSSTWISLLTLIGLSALAVLLRKRAPSVFAGWFFFLVAHSVESGFISLDLYYEHRNYLPAFGLLLAVVGLGELVTRNVPTNVLSLRQLGLLVIGGFALVFAFATMGRAHVWQHHDTIVEQGVKHHPKSLRVHMENASLAMLRGGHTESVAALAPVIASENPRHRLLARLSKATIDCALIQTALPVDLELAVGDAQPRLTVYETQAFGRLTELTKQKRCDGLNDSLVADTIVRMLAAAASQSDAAAPKSRLRYFAADLYAHAGRWKDALPLAELSWQYSTDPKAGALLTRIYLNNDMRSAAERTVAELAQRVKSHDRIGQAELAKAQADLQNE